MTGNPEESTTERDAVRKTVSFGDPTIIEGDLTTENAGEFASLLLALEPDSHGMIELDLNGLEIDGGMATAAAVNAIRQLASRATKLILTGAPQMLCHNLYRIGLLDGHIELLEMRQDEAAGF